LFIRDRRRAESWARHPDAGHTVYIVHPRPALQCPKESTYSRRKSDSL
jgi:hypothetical protein